MVPFFLCVVLTFWFVLCVFCVCGGICAVRPSCERESVELLCLCSLFFCGVCNVFTFFLARACGAWFPALSPGAALGLHLLR